MKIFVLNAPSNIHEIRAYLPESSEIIATNYQNIVMTVVNNKLGIFYKDVDIAAYDYVWITASWNKRDIAKVVSLYLESKGKRFTVVDEGIGASKLVDIALFALNGLPQPNTYFARRRHILHNLDQVIETCGFPVIAKSIKGTRGRRSFLANSKKELEELIQKTPSYVLLMFQQFVENEFDWGVVVANGTCVSAERSYRVEGAFLNNAAQGASEVFTNIHSIPSNIAEIAQKAHQTVGLEWGRADILQSSKNGMPYLLEVNRSPRMTSSSPEVEAFGQYLAKQIQSTNRLIN